MTRQSRETGDERLHRSARSTDAAARWVARLGVVASALIVPMAALTAQEAADALSETYRDWVVNCRGVASVPGDQTTRACEISQELRQTADGQLVLRVVLGVGDTGGPADVTFVTPFGVRVLDGVAVETAESNLARIDFLTCMTAGCVATGTLDAGVIDALSAGDTATVTMNATSGDEVRLDVSLSGFAAAWSRLNALTKP